MHNLIKAYNTIPENNLCVGDHIPWHSPLDSNESRIQHMLMAEDPQLHTISTPLGSVSFVEVHIILTLPYNSGNLLVIDIKKPEFINPVSELYWV